MHVGCRRQAVANYAATLANWTLQTPSWLLLRHEVASKVRCWRGSGLFLLDLCVLIQLWKLGTTGKHPAVCVQAAIRH